MLSYIGASCIQVWSGQTLIKTHPANALVICLGKPVIIHNAWYNKVYSCVNKIGEGQKNAFVSTSRAVWRKQREGHRLIHVGGVFSFQTKQVNTEEPPVGTVDSEGITSMFPASLLEAEIPNMGTEVKGAIEALYTAPRWMVQAEYYFDRLNRTELIVRMGDIFKAVSF